MIDFDYGIYLGPIRRHNCDFYYQHRNDPRIWKWCRQHDVIQEGRHEDWIELVSGNQNRFLMYEMIAADTHKVVGVCGLTDVDYINRRAEFSLYVIPQMQKRGYAKAGLKTLLTHGFLNLNMNRIWGETFENNPAVKLFIKLGFEYEGTRRQFYYRNGRYIDAHLVSLSMDQFEDQKVKWNPELELAGTAAAERKISTDP